MGFVLLAGLSALAAFAALGVTTRARLRGRAEELVAITLLWNVVIILPIYVLGLLGHLTARSLAIASPMVSLATLGLATRGRDFPTFLRETARTALGLLCLPMGCS